MSWFSSLKEKSLKIAQLYKNELSEFMTNLNEDVGKLMGKSENSFEEQDQSTDTESRKESCGSIMELAINTPNPTSLLEILQQYITKTITNDELKAKASIILLNPEDYLQSDPITLLLPQRSDFTCFQEFIIQDQLSTETCKGILNTNTDLFMLLNNIEIQNISKEESTKLLLSRFLYALIYLVEHSHKSQSPEKENVEELSFDQGAAIDNQGDALEQKSQTSEQFVVIEDGSSSSHHSNDTEKVESTGQRDNNNLSERSESEEWQIEEKAFSIEFYN